MAIYLDNQAVELAGDNLGAVLDGAMELLHKTGRIVVEVQLDGQALTGEQLDGQLGQAMGEAEVRLITADPRELAVGALVDVRAALGEARAWQDEAADLLQRDQAGEALKKISKAIEAWLHTQQAVVQSAALVGVNLDEFTVDGEDLGGFTQELADQLRELKSLIQSGDNVGLADAMQYEWPQTTERWDALVAALIARVGGNDE